jgi:thiosulfate/3-mercaptopyruvate sulfurtransferase
MKKIILILSTAIILFALDIPTNHLATTNWLKTNISNKNLVIIDTRKKELYKKSHITGAINYPKATFFQGKLGDIPKLPNTPLQMQEMLQNAGVTEKSVIVFYSAGKASKDFADAASGMWNSWLYGFQKSAILNGGFAKWTYEKKATTSKLPSLTKSDIELESYDRDIVASMNDVLDSLYDDKQITDARVGKFYTGEDTRKDLLRHGRIPTARLTPMIRYSKKNNDYFEFISTNEAKKTLYNSGYGVELNKPLTIYCNTGHKARGLWFVAKFLVGMKDVKVYDGGIVEYSRSNLPMEDGESME